MATPKLVFPQHREECRRENQGSMCKDKRGLPGPRGLRAQIWGSGS